MAYPAPSVGCLVNSLMTADEEVRYFFASVGSLPHTLFAHQGLVAPLAGF